MPRNRPSTPDSDGSNRATDRGVSEILGAILLFGLLIAMLVLVQVGAVPGWNQQVEYQHDQRAQTDVAELADSVSRVSATGIAESVAVELGTTYPVRPFLLNPPPASGTLHTVDRGPVTIRNAVASERDVRDYWTGETRSFETAAVAYDPAYNEYANAPTTVLEAGALYNDYDEADRALVLGGAKPVSGETISLTTITGTLSESGVRPESVAVRASSAPTRTVAVSGRNGDPITLSVRTSMPLATWHSYLEGQYVANGGHVLADSLAQTAPPNERGVRTVQFALEGSVTYDLRISRVAVGDGGTKANATYLTKVSGGGYTPAGSPTELVAQARDAYNAPTSGVPITFSAPSGTFVDGGSTVTVTTGSDGRATATYVPASGTANVEVSASSELDGASGTSDAERTAFDVSTVLATGGGDDAGEPNPRESDGPYLSSVTYVNGWNGNKWFEATFANDGSGTHTWVSARLAFYNKQVNPADQLPEYVDFYASTTATTGTRLELRGPYEPLGTPITFSGASTRTIRLDPGQTKQGGDVQSGDFMVISVRYADGSTDTYFVGAESTTSKKDPKN